MRKATWALVLWNALIGLWIFTGLNAVGETCTGGVCDTATTVGAGIGITLILIIWFIGFIVLALVWLMSRPKDNVTIFGPDGQEVAVSEKEARKRVSKGWTYQR